LQGFIKQLKRYRRANKSIAHHSKPLADFLGRDPGYFTTVYPMAEIGRFVADVSKIVGQPLEAERLQTRGPKFTPEALTADEIAKIKRLYAEDYDIYGRWF